MSIVSELDNGLTFLFSCLRVNRKGCVQSVSSVVVILIVDFFVSEDDRFTRIISNLDSALADICELRVRLVIWMPAFNEHCLIGQVCVDVH